MAVQSGTFQLILTLPPCRQASYLWTTIFPVKPWTLQK
jgi:hypothetical protein